MENNDLFNVREFNVINGELIDKCLWIDTGMHCACLPKELIKELIIMLSNTLEHYDLIQDQVDEVNDIRNINEWYKNRSPKPQKERTIKAGYIYIAKCLITGLFKIGRTTKTPQERIKQLRFTNPTLTLFKSYPVKDIKIEQEIHYVLADYSMGGEWFSLSDEKLFSVIEDMCNGIEHEKVNSL